MRARIAIIGALTVACSSGKSTMTPAHAEALRDSVHAILDDFRR
ncbi:MAG: hypothetical protein ACT4P6_23550 [Gemmatimonadaceae bacterium]